ncbi:MAG: RNA polymerase sigma factor [Leptospiraceae bacterium]|nr:RNA polymerase sigma factor [Leptospiraceae bacterium]
MEDKELRWKNWIVNSQQGDSVSYKKLLEELSKEIEMILAGKIFNPADREDLLQEILLGIHRAKDSFDPTKKIRPWLYSIINFKIIDYIRAYKRKSFISYQSDSPETPVYFDFINEKEEEFKILLEKMKLLPVKQKEMVRLLKLEGKSIKEVSELTGMSISSVKVTLHRAIKNLQKLVKRS